MFRWAMLIPLAILAAPRPAPAQDRSLGMRQYLRVTVTGQWTRVIFRPLRWQGPRFDQRVAPGQSLILPFDGCYEWQHTIGTWELDWSATNRSCPQLNAYVLPRVPGPHFVDYVIRN